MNDKVKVDTPEQAEFRAFCKEWLSKNKPNPFAGKARTDTHPSINSPEYQKYLQDWQKAAYDAGLVGCDYPKEYGGGGHTDCQRIANQEMVRAKTPHLVGKQGLSLVSPTLIDNGSGFLKKRFIPKALSGEELWCQGFSEPNAGSDVANQETFAEKKGDYWVINGQKVWTSLWEYADWMICLCRTDRSHKHKGLTYFCVPIKSELGKSVEVRPLINVNGGADFAEEFFKDLTVHDKYRIDQVGQGWAVTMTTLKHERGQGQFVEPVASGISLATKVESEEDKAPVEAPLITLAKKSVRNGKPAAEDGVIRDRIMQTVIREKGFDESNRRTAVKGLVDHPMRIPMQFKLVSTEISQDQAALAVDIEGVSANLRGAENTVLAGGGTWGTSWIGSFGLTIAAGTSEIQRNQLGERVLGLPKSK